jgi:hypothetical protein
MSSKMQRIQVAELQMSQLPLIAQIGGNPVPVITNYFDAIGSELIDQIFPDDDSMSPKDKEMRDQMMKAQEQANQIAELQLQILSREQDRLDIKTASEIDRIKAEIKKIGIEMIEVLARAAKLGEEAETESMKNAISQYTSQIGAITSAIDALGAMNALRISQLPPGASNGGAVPPMAQQPMY